MFRIVFLLLLFQGSYAQIQAIDALTISGVRNDGVAFSTEGINTFMAQNTSQKKEIVFSAGTYRFDCRLASLLCRSNVTLRGEGKVIFKCLRGVVPPFTNYGTTVPNYLSLPSIEEENISIQNIEFDGEKALTDTISSANQAGNLLSFFGVRNLHISQCVVRNAKNDGIVAAICQNVTIKNCQVFDIAKVGIYSSGSNEVVIANNYIKHISGIDPRYNKWNWGFGIEVSDTWHVSVLNNTILNCSTGILTDRDTRFFSISNNTIVADRADKTALSISAEQSFGSRRGYRFAWYSSYDGQLFDNVCQGMVWLKACHNVVVRNNQVKIESFPYWWSNALTLNECINCRVEDNHISIQKMQSKGAGIFLTSTGESNYGIVIGAGDECIGNRIMRNIVTASGNVTALLSFINIDTKQPYKIKETVAEENILNLVDAPLLLQNVVGFQAEGFVKNYAKNNCVITASGIKKANGSF